MLLFLVVVVFARGLVVVLVGLLKLLTAVLLVAHDGLQHALRQVQRVVPHQLIVAHLLVGQLLGVAPGRDVGCHQPARQGVALALDDAGHQVVGRPRQPRVAPLLLQSQHQAAGHLAELRTRHVAVLAVLVLMGHLAAPARVPHETPAVARQRQRVTQKPVVGLILGGRAAADRALGLDGALVQDDHAGHGVRAVHQRRRALHHLDRVDGAAVHLHAVLVAPLLALLAHAVAYDDDAVVAQSADDGFRDAATCGQLAHARQVGYGVDDVSRRRSAQLLRAHEADGGCGVLHLGVARNTGHHQLVQLQVPEEDVSGVFAVLVRTGGGGRRLTAGVLCCRRHAKTQQRQNDIKSVHSVTMV